MKEKDIAEKILLSYNDVFADIVNGTFFGGKQVVKEEELLEISPVNWFKDDENKPREQARDIAKLWEKNGIIFSFIGIENQTLPDKDMILRVISYDGATYKSQLGKDEVYPVFTIVIYWGKAEWKAPISIKERISCPKELEEYISDYKFKLIDMTRLQAEDIKKYNSDFQLVAGIMAEIKNYRPDAEEIKHPEEVLDLLDLIIGDERLKKIKGEIEDSKKEGRKVRMCTFLDELENSGIEKGLERGLKQGRLEGRLEGEERATFNIAKKLKESLAEIDLIAKVTGLSREQVELL